MFLVAVVSLFLVISCAPGYHFGVKDQAIGVPPQFGETEAAVAKAENSPGAKYCPEKIAKAKELGKKGVETYWACRTEEAMKLLAEARKLAKEAEGCQPPPPPPPPPPAPKPAPVFDTIYFDTNKSNITPTAAKALDRNGWILKDNPDAKVEIGGHTDGVGKDPANQALSEKRALSAKKYIQDKYNIPNSRLVTKGYGNAKPVADNKTQEGRSKNRRVEFKIIP